MRESGVRTPDSMATMNKSNSRMNIQKKPSSKKAISFLVAYLKNNVFTETGFTFSFDGSIFTSVGIVCESPFPSFDELL